MIFSYNGVFHNIIIHDESAADVCFLCVNRLKSEVPVHTERVFVLFVACKPDGGIAALLADIF